MFRSRGFARAGSRQKGGGSLIPGWRIFVSSPKHACGMPSQSHSKRSLAARDGNPPVKRFRVSRACDQCRQNREKCDGNQPQCAPCSDGKRQCTYSSNPKKRGLPPGYIRTIELALALAFQQDAELEASLTAKLGYVSLVLSNLQLPLVFSNYAPYSKELCVMYRDDLNVRMYADSKRS